MGKRFHVGDVLSVTTGCLVSPTHMGGIYGILNYLTQGNLFTHQLPRAMDECRPWLLRWHPEMAGVDASPVKDEATLKAWLAEQAARFGEWIELDPIPADDHTQKDPLTELAEMVPPERIVPVVLDDE